MRTRLVPAIHSLAVRQNGRLERAASHGTPASELAPIPPFGNLIPNPTGRPFVLGMVAHPREPIFYAGFVVEGRAPQFILTIARVIFNLFGQPRQGWAFAGWRRTHRGGGSTRQQHAVEFDQRSLDTSDPLNPVKIQDFQLAGPPAGSEQIGRSMSGGIPLRDQSTGASWDASRIECAPRPSACAEWNNRCPN